MSLNYTAARGSLFLCRCHNITSSSAAAVCFFTERSILYCYDLTVLSNTNHSRIAQNRLLEHNNDLVLTEDWFSAFVNLEELCK